jgi:hypothetical protein
MALRGSVTQSIDVPAGDVFALVTDAARLPEWNGIITRVVEAPAALSVGAEWVVELKAMGSSWKSRSRVLVLDLAARRFEYRSQTGDGNPSYGNWRWDVADHGESATVSVSWDLHPQTFWRRTLLGRIRHRQLRSEVRSSVQSLERVLAATREPR